METVDAKTGRAYRIYSYKGRPCRRIVLDSPLAKQLAGYVLIEKDLRNATVWLDEIEELRGNDTLLDKRGNQRSPDRKRYNVIKGLTVAMLTSYGKAFAQADGRRIKLQKKQLSSEYHQAHEAAIKLRNNFTAHSGAESPEKARVVIALPHTEKIAPKLYREMEQPDWFSEPNGITLKQLVSHAHQISVAKIEELEEKILREEVAPKGYIYWKNK